MRGRCLRRWAPSFACRIQFAVKTKILCRKHFGDIDDLPIVQSKVLDHLIHRLQPSYMFVALNLIPRQQIGFGRMQRLSQVSRSKARGESR